MTEGDSRVVFQWANEDRTDWNDCDLLGYESAMRNGFPARRVIVLAGHLPMLPLPSDERGSDGKLTYEAKAHNKCLNACAEVVVGLQGQIHDLRAEISRMIRERESITKHRLKIHQQPFMELLTGFKTAEIRRCSDREFAVGDQVQLVEVMASTGVETGREAVRTITHIQRGYGLSEDFCVLSYAYPGATGLGGIRS